MATRAWGRSATPVLHGLVVTLLLFSASMAAQRMFFSQAPGADADPQRPASGPGARSAASSYAENEDDESSDLAVTDSDPSTPKRGPATRDAGTAPDQTGTMNSGTANSRILAPDQAASHSAWFTPLAAVKSLFARSEGVAGAPGPVARNEPGPASAGPAPAGPMASQMAPTLDFIGVKDNGKHVNGADFRGLVDLFIHLTWNLPGGQNTQRVELFAPDGGLYQRFLQEFTSPTTSTTTETWVPVSGSWITQHSLFGAWRVEVYLDDGRTPVATSGFVLTE